MSRCDQCIVRELSSLKALKKEELIKISNSKTSYKVKKNKSIFEEGSNINGIFCIKSGVSKLTKLSENGKNQIIKLAKKGQLLGKTSMISDNPANLSAVAMEDMEVCFIPRSEIINLVEKNHKFSMSLMKNICDDLKESDSKMVSIFQKTVKERLAETLLYLQDTFGENEDNTLKIQLSREELASIIGTATESCIRLLSELNKEGFIELIGKKIKIKNLKNFKKNQFKFL